MHGRAPPVLFTWLFIVVVEDLRAIEGVAIAEPVGAQDLLGGQRHVLLQLRGEEGQFSAARPRHRIRLLVGSAQLHQLMTSSDLSSVPGISCPAR